MSYGLCMRTVSNLDIVSNHSLVRCLSCWPPYVLYGKLKLLCYPVQCVEDLIFLSIIASWILSFILILRSSHSDRTLNVSSSPWESTFLGEENLYLKNLLIIICARNFRVYIYASYCDTKFITNCWSCYTIRGPPGDLYVYLDVEEIEGIQRDGINLSSTVSISYLDAILGVVVKV